MKVLKVNLDTQGTRFHGTSFFKMPVEDWQLQRKKENVENSSKNQRTNVIQNF